MTLIKQLKTIPDPRHRKGRKHPLWLILFLSIKCTSIGGNGKDRDWVSLVSVYGHQDEGVVRLQLLHNKHGSEIEVAKQ
jgi:hypothetical protein